MKVVVDGVVYQEQSKGGISRIYKEILPIMCDMDESLRIKFLVPKKPKQSFPQHPHIKHCHIPELELYLRPNRLWGPLIPRAKWLARRLCTGRGKGQIWHSTHFTMPEIWDGLQIVTVHDMIYEHFADLFNTPWDDQFRKQRRACIQKADALICVSETTRQNLQRLHKIDSNSVYVVHNGYSNIFRQLEQQVSVLESPVKMPFLLYVGDRNHYKNADRLLQAYSVWKHRKKVALVVVGGQWKADEE
ncbi:MAG: glycosyltransferase family 4 protein, partial [Desulfobacteraceae bacterium]|nr:glycosyltransferase family 4 protein [Desulfobacteraceae bacterium]